MSERMYVPETIENFKARNGAIVTTIDQRFTSNSLKFSKCKTNDKSKKLNIIDHNCEKDRENEKQTNAM